MTFSALLSCVRAMVCVGVVILGMSCTGTAQMPAAPPADRQDGQIAVPPPPAEFLNRIPAGQMTFLNDYENKTTKELWKDKRFKELLKVITPRTTYHYGRDMALSDSLEDMLTGSPLPVDVQE